MLGVEEVPVSHAPKMAQIVSEFDALVRLAHDSGVRSYLEIGSQHGGSFWRMGEGLGEGALMLSIDRPNPGSGTEKSLLECVGRLRELGRDAHVVLGDSTDEEIIERARAMGPFDLVFIDGNHTLPYVTRDWQNYGPMGGMVAFHDIAFEKEVSHPGKLPIEVSKLWRQIEAEGTYRTRRFVADGSDKGIGVAWRT